MKKFLIITGAVCLTSLFIGVFSFIILDMKSCAKVYRSGMNRAIGFGSIRTWRIYDKIADRLEEKIEDKIEEKFAEEFDEYDTFDKFTDKLEYDIVDRISDNADSVADLVSDAVSNAVLNGASKYYGNIARIVFDAMTGKDGYMDKNDILRLNKEKRMICEKEIAINSIKHMDITAENASFIFARSKEANVKILIFEPMISSSKADIKQDIENDTLSLAAVDDNKNSSIYIMLPEKHLIDININLFYGDLVLAAVNNDIKADLNNGDIIANFDESGNARLESNDGDIIASFNNTVNARINVSCIGELISFIDGKGQVSPKQKEMEYILGDGAYNIELITHDGDIIIG